MTTRTTTGTTADDTAKTAAKQTRKAQEDHRAATRLRLEAAAARFRRAANQGPTREE